MAFNETGSEVSKTPETHKLDFDADKLIGFDTKESKPEVSNNENLEPVDSDKLIEPTQREIEPVSTYEERLEQTPAETSQTGTWEGERGESLFVPKDPDIQKHLSEFGIRGIEFKDAKPDFASVAIAKVEIEGMSKYRQSRASLGIVGNFEKADIACAKQWNDEGQGGKTDWGPKDVASWRKTQAYSWHECNDMKTMQLVPRDIHGVCSHLGGVGEVKALSRMDGIFDD